MDHNYDREIYNPDNYKLGIFYFNPSDKRVVVPKRNRFLGWTLNFGLRRTYLIIILVTTIIIVGRYLVHYL